MAREILQSPVLRIAVTEKERQQVLSMLTAQKLPVTDIGEDTLLYQLLDGEKLIGTAGLDIFEDCALLRSVSVMAGVQGKGYGRLLNDQAEKFAKESGINCIYLVTTTAKDFFERQGYCVIKREDAPAAIKDTEQFSGLCPSSAIVMKKRL
ncbi:MAG TPA: arsenic resistance N-acetyltransferase ArsN2 [Ferruginibacter sp.]|nr:arsenic resistance N-acetyltransferase ArsN2 [Ferruginibacter sp.]